ncbi:hypothetical protein Sango_1884500 [Sesamum angolense]|uniref:Uncharacterized protein n=1 Tax=Sesamum angolense TaxID=2727404 RepID=A0AAE1WJ51_9LAMI|nr:hypothetical protein Sango_1884500 [Sesamum angolense]
MFRIVPKLRLCGDDVTDEQMLKKIFSTFHASNLVLPLQYRERGFKNYSKLISCLLVAEENNQLLLNNHHTHPTSSKPFPENSVALLEANATSSRKGSDRNNFLPQSHSYGRGRGHGGRGRARDTGRGDHNTYGLIPIFRRKMGTRQRINMRKLQMEIFAIDVGCKTMMYRIIENSNGHPLKDLKFLVKDKELNISHLKVFGCAVYVPIPLPQRTKMGPQRRLGIYVGFESPSIIKYLEPMTGDQFTASELEVQRIIHLQSVANRLPNAFIDTKKVTKSHIPAENIPARLKVPEATLTQPKASESQISRKRGRPLGSKDANSRTRKEHIISINHDANVTSNNVSEDKIPEVVLSKDSKHNEQDLDDSYEMSINYAHNSLVIERLKMQLMDVVTAYLYLYGPLDTDIYIRIPEGLNMPEVLKSKPRHISPEEIRQAADYLESEFEMKDLSTTKYCLGLQFEHTKVRSLDVNKDPFCPPA